MIQPRSESYSSTTPPRNAINPASANNAAFFACPFLLLADAPLVLSFVVVDPVLPAAVEVALPLPVELLEKLAGATTTESGILRSTNPSPHKLITPLPATSLLAESRPMKASRLVRSAWRQSVHSKG